MARNNNNNKLKAFVRFDGSGRIIPSSLIVQAFKPKVGNYKEIDAKECCNYTTTTTTTAAPTTTTSTTVAPTTTTTTTPGIVPSRYEVGNNDSENYVINGVSNPTLSLVEGEVYSFVINAPGHPFWIKTVPGTGTGNQYNTGVTNNGTDSGTITFIVPIGAPSTLYYNCQYHSSMAGTINITP